MMAEEEMAMEEEMMEWANQKFNSKNIKLIEIK